MKNLPLDFNWKYYVKFNNLEINSFIKAKYHYLNIGFKKNLLYKENLEIVSNSFDNNNNKIVDFKENLNTNKIIINSTDNYDLKKNDDPIFLVLQYYIDKNPERQKEIEECLERNIKLKKFKKIFLLNEEIYNLEKLNNTIKEINFKKRLTYQDFFDFIKTQESGYYILCNSDIFFNETIENIRYGSLSEKKSIYMLTRYDYLNIEKSKEIMLNHHQISRSQDTWIIHNKFSPEKTEYFNFNLGFLGCDNALVYIFNDLNYKIFNDPYKINTFHLHNTQIRNYNKNNIILKPYLGIQPNFKEPIKSINQISKIYVLNMENEKWKFDKIYEECKKFGIETLLERFIATDGNLNQEFFKTVHQKYINSLPNIKRKYYLKKLKNGFTNLGLFRSFGAFGCLMSNIKIFEDAIKNNYENIIIFQDDIYFHKNFLNLCNNFLENHPNFTGIYLGYSQHINISVNINNKTAGLFGIILNKRCFQLILEELKKYREPDDVCVPKILIEYFKDSIYKCDPILVIPDVSKSKTINDRDTIKHSKKMNWELSNFNMDNRYY